MAAHLQESIEKLSKMFLGRMSQFETELKLTSTSGTVDLVTEFTAFRSFIAESLKCLHQQLELLAHSVDRLETQSRRKILLLHGVGEVKDENLTQVVAGVVKEKLQIDGFTISDIRRCHRMGRPSAPHRHRPILVKFQEVAVRDKIWFTKTKLKGTGITASEFLTKSRHDIFMSARENFGVNKCWTKEGCVYILGANGERHRVVSLSDLNEIIAACSQQDVTKASSHATKAETTRSRRNATSKK